MTAAPPDGSAAPRWRRLEPDARREQILDCAVRLFGERPYAAVSTTEIAARAGVARGLLNHYFGTKRDLYLQVVRRLVTLPDAADVLPAGGTMASRAEGAVTWFLDAMTAYGPTFIAVTGAEGVGTDPQVEQILAEADDAAARKILVALQLPADLGAEHHLAAIRAYGGMVKAAVREWLGRGSMTREQAQLLLTRALVGLVRDVLPELSPPHRAQVSPR